MKNLIFILFISIMFIACDKTADIGPNTNAVTSNEVTNNINTGVYYESDHNTSYEVLGNVEYVPGSIIIDSTSNVDSVSFFVEFKVNIDYRTQYNRFLAQLAPESSIINFDTITHVTFNSYECSFNFGRNDVHDNVMPDCRNSTIKVVPNSAGILIGETNVRIMMYTYLKAQHDVAVHKWWNDDYTIKNKIRIIMGDKDWNMAIVNSTNDRYYNGARWDFILP